ncbi:hypothetical protein AYI70_g3798 [Smittium culicis]|uniref:Uncharacterized protein n=1 Tax=Smittium culicis TaxID=133412 RepID=A0A1R1Y1S9_9FUNG|nr:hypothetical protein AYI70_g3798 [Smittium culicis]
MATTTRKTIIFKNDSFAATRDNQHSFSNISSLGNNNEFKGHQKKLNSTKKPSKNNSPTRSKINSSKHIPGSSINNSREKRSSNKALSPSSSDVNNSSTSDSNLESSPKSTTDNPKKSSQRNKSKQRKPWKKQRDLHLSDDSQSFSVEYLKKSDYKLQNSPKSLAKNNVTILKRDGSTNNLLPQPPKNRPIPRISSHSTSPLPLDSAIKFASKDSSPHSRSQSSFAPSNIHNINSVPKHTVKSILESLQLGPSQNIVNHRLVENNKPTFPNVFENDTLSFASRRNKAFSHYAGASFNNSSPDAKTLPPPAFLPPSRDVSSIPKDPPPPQRLSRISHPSNLPQRPHNQIPQQFNSNPAVNLASIFQSLGIPNSSQINPNKDSAIIHTNKHRPNFEINDFAHNAIDPPRSNSQSVFA